MTYNWYIKQLKLACIFYAPWELQVNGLVQFSDKGHREWLTWLLELSVTDIDMLAKL